MPLALGEPLVVFWVGGSRWGLALAKVERVVAAAAVTPLPKAPPIALGVVNLAGRVLPVIDLRRRLGIPSRAPIVSDRFVVTRARRHRLALLVDSVEGVSDLPAKSVSPPGVVLPGIEQLAGVAALPDGVILIQDLDAFLSLEEEQQLDEGLNGAVP